jgi:hypothetical protein
MSASAVRLAIVPTIWRICYAFLSAGNLSNPEAIFADTRLQRLAVGPSVAYGKG